MNGVLVLVAYSVCVGVEGLYCVWVSKACRACVRVEGL